MVSKLDTFNITALPATALINDIAETIEVDPDLLAEQVADALSNDYTWGGAARTLIPGVEVVNMIEFVLSEWRAEDATRGRWVRQSANFFLSNPDVYVDLES